MVLFASHRVALSIQATLFLMLPLIVSVQIIFYILHFFVFVDATANDFRTVL